MSSQKDILTDLVADLVYAVGSAAHDMSSHREKRYADDCKKALLAEIDKWDAILTRYEWLTKDGDTCAGIVADAYSGWDTDKPWSEALHAEMQHRGLSVNQRP